jgi:hypothetical protein
MAKRIREVKEVKELEEGKDKEIRKAPLRRQAGAGRSNEEIELD